MKTLFVSDLDGTLLTSAENISPYSLEKLNAMIDGGMPFTYATARSLNSAAKAVWGLRQNLPVILYNGAVIMEPSGGSMLYNNPFNAGQREYIRSLLQKYGLSRSSTLFRRGANWSHGRGDAKRRECCAISRAAAATRGCIPWTAKARSMRAIFSILPVSTKRRGSTAYSSRCRQVWI
ncbi:MAG: HAD family hydrolase [Candidatus Borkfalkia sp.]